MNGLQHLEKANILAPVEILTFGYFQFILNMASFGTLPKSLFINPKIHR
jgi:uncharacterized membrane protein YvlD (DUF360 family)